MNKAFDYAVELTKQLITLATAIITAVVTLFDKAHVDAKLGGYGIKTALIIYLVSVIFGIFTLMALIGNAAGNATSPYTPNLRFFSGVQIVLFLLATLWIVIVAVPS